MNRVSEPSLSDLAQGSETDATRPQVPTKERALKEAWGVLKMFVDTCDLASEPVRPMALGTVYGVAKAVMGRIDAALAGSGEPT